MLYYIMRFKMSRLFSTVSAITLLTGSAALADSPKVATDIAPVHSLVSRVMDGIGKPDLIVPCNHKAMRTRVSWPSFPRTLIDP